MPVGPSWIRKSTPPRVVHAEGSDFHEEIDTASFKNSEKAGFCKKSEGFDTAYSLDTRGADTDDTNRHRPYFEGRRLSKVTGIDTALNMTIGEGVLVGKRKFHRPVG